MKLRLTAEALKRHAGFLRIYNVVKSKHGRTSKAEADIMILK